MRWALVSLFAVCTSVTSYSAPTEGMAFGLDVEGGARFVILGQAAKSLIDLAEKAGLPFKEGDLGNGRRQFRYSDFKTWAAPLNGREGIYFTYELVPGSTERTHYNVTVEVLTATKFGTLVSTNESTCAFLPEQASQRLYDILVKVVPPAPGPGMKEEVIDIPHANCHRREAWGPGQVSYDHWCKIFTVKDNCSRF